MLTSLELCDKAGVTYRQLDYWQRADIIQCKFTNEYGGSGSRRYFNEDLVPLLRFLSEVQTLYGFKVRDLRRIITSFPVGSIKLNERLTLSWDPNDYSM